MPKIDSPLALFKYDFPSYIDGKHLHILNKRLVKFINGDIENLAVFMPPRHSKSMMCSVYLPTYWMLKDPDITIIQASHSMNLAEQFVSQSRNLVRDLSPYKLNESFQRMNEYKMSRPHTGHVKGVGVGSSITGFGAKVIILDDLVKDAEAAFAPNMRKKLEDYYQGTLSSRLMPKGQKLLIMTRWNVDDISTKIIGEHEEDWTVLEMSAVCEDPSLPLEKELGRSLGAPLWPEFWPLPELEKRKKSVGTYYWNASYLQRPVPPEGNLLNPNGLQYYTRTPNIREHKARIMAVDLAISEATRADETVVTILDVDVGGYYVEAQFAWRKNSDYTIAEITKLYNYFHPDAAYVESIGFQEVIRKALVNNGCNFMPLVDRRNKEVKVGELAPHLDNGRIFLKNPMNKWEELVNQIQAFPLAQHDDRIESLWMAISKAEQCINPYTEWKGEHAYTYSNVGLVNPDERPKSVLFDENNNPYSSSQGYKIRR